MKKYFWFFALILLLVSPSLRADFLGLPDVCNPNFCNGKSGDPLYGACCDCYSDRVCLPINDTPRVWNQAFVGCVGASEHHCCKPSTAATFSGAPADTCASTSACTNEDGDICTIPLCATKGSWGGNDCPSGPTFAWEFTPTACIEYKIGGIDWDSENPVDPPEYRCCKAGFGISGDDYQCCVNRVKGGGAVGTPAAGPHCPASGTTGTGTTGSGTGSATTGGGGGEPSSGTGANSGETATGTDDGAKTTDDPSGENVAAPGPNTMSGGSCSCRMDASVGSAGTHGLLAFALLGWLAPLLALRFTPTRSSRAASRKYRTRRG